MSKLLYSEHTVMKTFHCPARLHLQSHRLPSSIHCPQWSIRLRLTWSLHVPILAWFHPFHTPFAVQTTLTSRLRCRPTSWKSPRSTISLRWPRWRQHHPLWLLWPPLAAYLLNSAQLPSWPSQQTNSTSISIPWISETTCSISARKITQK